MHFSVLYEGWYLAELIYACIWFSLRLHFLVYLICFMSWWSPVYSIKCRCRRPVCFHSKVEKSYAVERWANRPRVFSLFWNFFIIKLFVKYTVKSLIQLICVNTIDYIFNIRLWLIRAGCMVTQIIRPSVKRPGDADLAMPCKFWRRKNNAQMKSAYALFRTNTRYSDACKTKIFVL